MRACPILLCSVLSFGFGAQSDSDTDARAWVEQHRFEIIDRVMPVDEADVVTIFRSYRDLFLDVEERYFRISPDPRTNGFAAVSVIWALATERDLSACSILYRGSISSMPLRRFRMTIVAAVASWPC